MSALGVSWAGVFTMEQSARGHREQNELIAHHSWRGGTEAYF
jgi:hypothetical protein